MATPIGNLGDVTLRALEELAAADLIACEDTRVTAKLLAAHGISRPLAAYHEHNARRMGPVLIERLRRGERIALVTDAGTPLVSDPGLDLVRAAQAEGLAVTIAPGASAPIAALALSGLPAERFLFAGFLPATSGDRRRALAELSQVQATLLLFEAPHRLPQSLRDMAMVLGDREAAVARELTKLHEEVRRGRLAGLAEDYALAGPPRGEVVVVVAPPEAADEAGRGTAPAALDEALSQAMKTLSLRDAAAAVAAATGASRREVYRRALALLGKRP